MIYISVVALQSIILTEGFEDILVRLMGGKKFLLTFLSEEGLVCILRDYS